MADRAKPSQRGRRRTASSTESPDTGAQTPARRRKAEEPFDVHIEFVVLDGDAGKQLAERQAAVMRRVLQWVHAHPAGADPDVSATD